MHLKYHPKTKHVTNGAAVSEIDFMVLLSLRHFQHMTNSPIWGSSKTTLHLNFKLHTIIYGLNSHWTYDPFFGAEPKVSHVFQTFKSSE